MSFISLNRRYIRAVNSDDTAELYKFYDDISESEKYFTSKIYIWNIIRGKEFCRNIAEWAIDWYRTCSNMEDGRSAMDSVIRVIHWVMSTESHDKIKRSLVWKLTKVAPILTADTLPFISEERLYNILDSDKWIVSDGTVKPLIQQFVLDHIEDEVN